VRWVGLRWLFSTAGPLLFICWACSSPPVKTLTPLPPKQQLLKLSQLQLQFLHWQLAQRAEAQQALEDESLALAAGLAGMPRLSFGELRSGLGALGNDVSELGMTRVDAILQQARAKERGLAKAAIAQAVSKAKSRVEGAATPAAVAAAAER